MRVDAIAELRESGMPEEAPNRGTDDALIPRLETAGAGKEHLPECCRPREYAKR